MSNQTCRYMWRESFFSLFFNKCWFLILMDIFRLDILLLLLFMCMAINTERRLQVGKIELGFVSVLAFCILFDIYRQI